jgi:hypothetical protein
MAPGNGPPPAEPGAIRRTAEADEVRYPWGRLYVVVLGSLLLSIVLLTLLSRVYR